MIGRWRPCISARRPLTGCDSSITGWPFDLDTVTVDLRPAYAYLRDGSGYEPRIRALAKLERQDLFWTYGKGEIEGGFDYLAYEAYTSYGPRGRLGFSTPVISQRVTLDEIQVAFDAADAGTVARSVVTMG